MSSPSPSLIKNPAERADLKLLMVSGGGSWARDWGCLHRRESLHAASLSNLVPEVVQR